MHFFDYQCTLFNFVQVEIFSSHEAFYIQVVFLTSLDLVSPKSVPYS